MAYSTFRFLAPLVVAVAMAAMTAATPPGIANNPSHATCKIKKYKHCYNLVHVCPKFCPDQCTVECASCKPICGAGDANPPPENDPTPATPSPSPPSPPSETYYSPPPPSSQSHSPPTPPTDSNPPSIPPVNPNPPSMPPANPNPPSTPPVKPNPPSTPPANPNPPTNLNPPSTPPTSPNPPSTPPTNPNSPSTPPANSYPPTNPNPPTPSTPNSPSLSSPPPPTPSETPSSPTTNTPSPPSPTPSPPSSSAGAGKKKVRCKNVNYPKCYNMVHTCPSACPGGCEVDCVTCKPVCNCDRPGTVCQDPRFIGGDGITFYFHGKKDRDFCLVSDPNLHINAHFIGKRNPNLKRDFTWVQSLGILFHTHRLFIAAQKTAVWDDSADRLAISLNGRPVVLPESEGSQWQYPAGEPSIVIVRLAAANHVMVEAKGQFRITAKVVPITEEESRIHSYGITEEDSFAHLDVGFKFFGLSGKVNGVLGQTYGAEYVSGVNLKAPMPVMGRGEEFETSSLFAPDCAVARFGGGGGGSEELA